MPKIQGQIDGYSRLKKCMKITFIVDEKDSAGVAAQLDLYIKKPITLEILTDKARQAIELVQITPDQRAKIFALIKDIAAYSGDGKENMREQLTEIFCDEQQIPKFSLSDCMSDTAAAFINWLISFAFEQGVPLKENPVEGLDDIESYIKICIAHRKCCVCGQDGALVKWETKEDSTELFIPLCDAHKMKAAKVGRRAFNQEYHVMGVVFE
jgi:hypothetical protein